VQLAVVTLAGTVAIETFIFRNPTFSGGFAGAQVPEPTLFGHRFGPSATVSLGDGLIPSPVFGAFCLLLTVFLMWVVTNIRKGGVGRRFLAVRANERAAAGMGVDVRRTKVLAFGISAAIAGVAGVLSGYRFGSVTSNYFGALSSLQVLAFAYLGGVTSVAGAVVGGALVSGGLLAVAMSEGTGLSTEYLTLIGGVGLVLTAIFNPGGIVGAWHDLGVRILSRFQDKGEDGGTVKQEEEKVGAL
jgi:ABC-type branched-subunit amino acid transport system permease subunit